MNLDISVWLARSTMCFQKRDLHHNEGTHFTCHSDAEFRNFVQLAGEGMETACNNTYT
jgi:hypothetical protein